MFVEFFDDHGTQKFGGVPPGYQIEALRRLAGALGRPGSGARTFEALCYAWLSFLAGGTGWRAPKLLRCGRPSLGRLTNVGFKVAGLAYRYDDASLDGLRALPSRLCKCCNVLCAVKRGNSRRCINGLSQGSAVLDRSSREIGAIGRDENVSVHNCKLVEKHLTLAQLCAGMGRLASRHSEPPRGA
jgi:hypothetical protein